MTDLADEVIELYELHSKAASGCLKNAYQLAKQVKQLEKEIAGIESEEGFLTYRSEFNKCHELLDLNGIEKIEPISGEEYSLYGRLIEALQQDKGEV